jgi:hypothetical protein
VPDAVRERVAPQLPVYVSAVAWGPAYGCRIKASPGVVPSLLEDVYSLVDKAEGDGDTELLIGCAIALKAMERPTH